MKKAKIKSDRFLKLVKFLNAYFTIEVSGKRVGEEII